MISPDREPGAPRDAGARAQLLDYWRVLVQRRWVVATCLGIVVATTALATLFTVPQYEAVATLQIDRQAPDVLTFKNVVGVDPSHIAYQDFYQTQYKILKSRSVLRLAVEALDLPNLPEFAQRKEKPIKRLRKWARSFLPGSGSPAGPPDPLEPALRFLEENLEIRPVRNSQLVLLAFEDRSPTLARDVANAVVAAYLEFNYQSVYGTTTVARDFLTKEVLRVQQEIADLEKRLQDYGAAKEILSVDAGAQDISQQALAALNARYIEAKGRLAVAEARFRAVESAAPEALPEVLQSPLIANLKQQYAEIERRRSQMAERFRPDWPALKQLEEEMRQARARLDLEAKGIAAQVRGAARNEFEKAEGEVRNLSAEVERQKKEVQRVNRDAVEYASLKAEIETKRKIVTDLVSRQSQTAASERLQDTGTSNIRVVDPAIAPEDPVRPKKLLNLLLALVLGSGLGVGMAFLLDYLDNTVKNEQDVSRFASAAVLGYVPRYQALKLVEGKEAPGEPEPPEIDLASHVEPRSGFAEAFKNLRTSLLLASPEHPPRRIVVTSCEPQDGKSTVATNLAVVLTQLGKRVLLVDADLRRPRLHKSFAVGNDLGLSNVLSGNATAEEAVHETDIPGLSLVTSGPVPPNPSELLGSAGMQSFLARLDGGKAFDHVILDSPPVGSVTDPVVLAAATDVAIVVVRSGKTTREVLAQSVARLRQARVRVAGAVLNDVTEEAGSYYYGRYKYYRPYHVPAEGTEEAPKRRLLRRHGRRARGA